MRVGHLSGTQELRSGRQSTLTATCRISTQVIIYKIVTKSKELLQLSCFTGNMPRGYMEHHLAAGNVPPHHEGGEFPRPGSPGRPNGFEGRFGGGEFFQGDKLPTSPHMPIPPHSLPQDAHQPYGGPGIQVWKMSIYILMDQ